MAKFKVTKNGYKLTMTFTEMDTLYRLLGNHVTGSGPEHKSICDIWDAMETVLSGKDSNGYYYDYPIYPLATNDTIHLEG